MYIRHRNRHPDHRKRVAAAHSMPAAPLSRRALLQGLGLLAGSGLLAACGVSRGATSTSDVRAISLQDFPEGLGRGYPVAAVADVDNSSTGTEAGDTAPNFRMVLDGDRGLSLHDLAGRPIVLNFWATWCGPCRIEMPELVRVANQDSDILVLAVNVQEELERIQGFAEDFQMTMPIVRDQEAELRNLYAVRGMPTTIFIDRASTIGAVWQGVLTPDRLAEMLGKIT